MFWSCCNMKFDRHVVEDALEGFSSPLGSLYGLVVMFTTVVLCCAVSRYFCLLVPTGGRIHRTVLPVPATD